MNTTCMECGITFPFELKDIVATKYNLPAVICPRCGGYCIVLKEELE